MNVYKYLDYKKFLSDQAKAHEKTYGYKTKLANAAGCQKSFLSQVLTGFVHFTFEHAVGAARFWHLDDNETEYFVELVALARAGNVAHRDYVQRRLNRIKADAENLTKRFRTPQVGDPEASILYYSAWYFSAIHVALSLPEITTVKAVSNRLQISEALVSKALEQLMSIGIVKKQGNRWMNVVGSVHVPRDSILNTVNHVNWRHRAITSSFLPNQQDIHYTGVCSISRKDFEVLRQMTLKFIDASRDLVGPSAEEEVICVGIDVFRV